MKVSEGDFQAADYFLDCSIFEFYHRLKTRNNYVDWYNKEMEKQMKKGGK